MKNKELKKNDKSIKMGKIVSYLFIPVLIPVRVLVKVCRETKNEFCFLFYPVRLKRAKKKALRQWRQSGGEIRGIRVGYKIYLYDNREMKRLNKRASRVLKGLDYKLVTVFTVKNGRLS